MSPQLTTIIAHPYRTFAPFAVATFVFHLFTALRYANGISGADGQWYWNETELFMSSQGPFDERQFSRSYQYPGFIAFAGSLRYILGVNSPGFIYVANALMVIGVGVFTVAVGRWAFNDFVGVIGGISVMWLPSIAWAIPTIGYEVLFLFMTMGALAALVAVARSNVYESSKRMWLFLTVGLLMLFGAYFTVSKALVLLPVAVWFIWRQVGRRPALTYLAGFITGLLLIGIRNLITHGVFFFTSLNTGATLWLSNNPQATGTYMDPPWIPGVAEVDGVVQVHPAFDVPVNLYNDLFTSAAMNWIANNPLQFLNLLWLKAGFTWAPPTLAASSTPVQISESLLAPLTMAHYLLLISAFAGVVIWAWAKPMNWHSPGLVFWSGLLLIVATMPFHGSARYQSAFMPMVLLFALAALQAIWLKWRMRNHPTEVKA